MAPSNEMKKIVLRDLQSVLRKSRGQSIIVENYTTKSLLPPGENYGSTIMSVHAVIRRNPEAEKEDLHLIAKMAPPTDFQRMIFQTPLSFPKEIAMYVEIMPAYKQLEREAGIPEEETFDVPAEYYGSRLSLDPDVQFDDDAVLLLENLKVKGYYIGQRDVGYDFEHSKVTMRAMARFHALGIAMRLKKPELFGKLRGYAKALEMQVDEFEKSYGLMLKKIEADPEARQYYDNCKRLLTTEMAIESWCGRAKEPWATIVHADFWVNNIMFHRGEDGKVDDIKFVDFQVYLYLSPIRELLFYLFSSLDNATFQDHLDDLIDLYHQSFIEVLTRLGCDTECFSREKFNAQMANDAKFEFGHLCFMLKVLTLDTKETNFDYDKMQSVMTGHGGNQLYGDRLSRVVVYFGKQNWI